MLTKYGTELNIRIISFSVLAQTATLLQVSMGMTDSAHGHSSALGLAFNDVAA